MSLSKSEIQLALRVSKKIQHFLEITNSTNLRSTDVFPYLVRQGLFEPDRHNGIYFRRFLKKLSRYGELKSLIPQCSHIAPLKDEIFSEWYFIDAKDKMPKTKSSENITEVNTTVAKTEIKKAFVQPSVKMDINEAIDIIKMLIAGVNPITERPQDDLGVCADITVVEALKTIIEPESYRDEINKIESDIIKTEEQQEIVVSEKFLSATALGNLKGLIPSQVIDFMIAEAYIISYSVITDKGLDRGIKFKQNSKGSKWIVYPESLAELL